MKVGDLVRLMVSNHLGDPSRLNNQLAVIVRHNEAACNPWKVKVINGVVLWLKSYELEKL
jgi:hypothetical protein